MIALAGGLAYRRIWRRIRGEALTPTGYGAFLALFLAVGAVVVEAPIKQIIAYSVVVLATAVYWFDDVNGLSVKLRLAIQFATGAIVASLFAHPTGVADFALFVPIFVAGGALNVILTNVVNFYDGADLNLGLFIALTAVSILTFGSNDSPLAAVAVFLLAFVLPFAFLNRTPRVIYLGDSGSFAFACFLTMVAGSYPGASATLDGLVFAPLALPLLDVFFVLALRIARGENLLTRNYHHLYQKIQAGWGGFSYLAPQVINYLLIIILAHVLRRYGMNLLDSSLLAMATSTVALYAICLSVIFRRAST